VTTLVAQIAPQRSTQYSALASFLAPVELQLSPLGHELTALEPVTLGGQAFLRFELPTEPNAHQLAELGSLATLDACFRYYEQIGDVPGPLLRPLELRFIPALPAEIVAARRYRGKTNELFTHFLCNLARFSSRWVAMPWRDLRVFDPLAGGGTTLFIALVLGAEAAGIEQSDQDVNSTVAFLRQFLQEARISHRVQEERLRRLGRRWSFSIGKANPQRCILALGSTADAAGLIAGFKPHLIVADLPYGIQHEGPLVELLTHALPVWAGLLPPGGVLVYAWDATRFPRAEMIGLVETTAALTVLNTPPYDALSHRVDRVIKQRDVLVALRP
jgi:hypothetical protein